MGILPLKTKESKIQINNNLAIISVWAMENGRKWYREYRWGKSTLTWFHQYLLSSSCEPGTGHTQKSMTHKEGRPPLVKQ